MISVTSPHASYPARPRPALASRGPARPHRPDGVYFTVTPRGGAFLRDCAYVAIIKAFGVPRIFTSTPGHRARARRVVEAAALQLGVSRRVGDPPLPRARPRDRRPGRQPSACARREWRAGSSATSSQAPRRDGPPRVLFLANMIVDKGPLDPADARSPRCTQRSIAFEATFAGARSSDGSVEAFEAEVAALGLRLAVRYVGPVLRRGRGAGCSAPTTSTRSDPSRRVPAGRARGDAARPADCQHAPWRDSSEIVSDGESGLLVEPRDATALAARLQCLVEEPLLRRQMGDRARARYDERYTMARLENNLAHAFAQVLDA